MAAAEVQAAALGAAESDAAAEDVAEEAAAVVAEHSWSPLRFDLPPRRLYHFARQFRAPCSSAGNFLKGVKWSPDGSSFLTSSDDNSLRLFYLPEDACSAAAVHTVEVAGGGEIRQPVCLQVLVVIIRYTSGMPDATTGELQGTYRAYDAMDEITSALSISFNSTGAKLFAGYNKAIRVFDVHRPGRDFEQYSLLKGNEGPTDNCHSDQVPGGDMDSNGLACKAWGKEHPQDLGYENGDYQDD